MYSDGCGSGSPVRLAESSLNLSKQVHERTLSELSFGTAKSLTYHACLLSNFLASRCEPVTTVGVKGWRGHGGVDRTLKQPLPSRAI
eukprot:jgi/Picsp_1/1131/NSC_04612-R1_---NA---